VMVFQWFGGVYKDERELKNFFARFSVEPAKLFTMYPDYAISDEEKKAFLAERTACIVGRPLAERHGFKPGDRITLKGDYLPVTLELTVRGFYDKPRDNENLFFHHAYLRESLPADQKDMVGTFGVLAENAGAVLRVAEAIDKLFENSPVPTKTETERAFELSFLAFLGNVKLFLLSLSGALTFTLVLVSANTMAMSVRERTREVGILKTLGYTPPMILVIILGEALAIALAGGALGLGLAWLVCAVMRQTPILFVDLKEMSMSAEVAGVTLAVAALVGVLGSLLPAWGAARRPIIDALRVND